MAGLKPYVAAVAPVAPDVPLSAFARSLVVHGAVPVLEAKRLVGLVHADIVADREHPPEAHARSMASRPAHVEKQATPAEAAAAVLREHVRALPVLDGEGYDGMVTERTLLGMPEFAAMRRPVHEVASGEPFVVREDDTVGHARAVMRAQRIGRLPVVDGEGRLEGLVEWPHLVTLEARRDERTERSFKEPVPLARLSVTVAMDTAPLTVGTDDTVAEVTRRMQEKNQTAAVLVVEQHPVAIVTAEDLLELVAVPGQGEAIWVQMTGLADLDPSEQRLVDRHIQESVSRLAHAVRDPEYLYLHMKTYHETGGRRKYSLRARLADAKAVMSARSHGYDLAEAVDVVMERLERIARENRDRTLDRVRATSVRYALRSEERA